MLVELNLVEQRYQVVLEVLNDGVTQAPGVAVFEEELAESLLRRHVRRPILSGAVPHGQPIIRVAA